MEQEIIYKCRCMVKEASVTVPFRRTDEDILAWMESCVQPAIGLDHRRRSPLCRASKLDYCKIPVPENAPTIGVKPSVN